jgi:uncharacterized protein YukE
MRIRVKKTIVPKEAYEIAGNFRRAAQEARNLASQLQRVGNSLNATWEGNSKNNFMQKINPEPGNLNDYANYLEQCAHKIEHMTVDIWEEKEIQDITRK